MLRRLSSIILTNILLSDKVVPELIQHECARTTWQRRSFRCSTTLRRGDCQIEAFSRLDKILEIDSAGSPAMRAAQVVLDVVEQSSSARAAAPRL